MDINQLVALSVKHNASDLHLCPGQIPIMRIDGVLRRLDNQELVAATWVDHCGGEYLDTHGRRALALTGQADCAVTFPQGQRARGHFFRQQSGVSVAFRLIPAQCPTLATLALPASIAGLLSKRQGLLLVTGATGSGKSSSLAAMLDHLNEHHRVHIITLEDPIEYLHRCRHSLIQQREIGVHCPDVASGLRAVLREDPDIVLLGELRDPPSIRLALTAAETGHLVLATLHARHAAQAVDRLVDGFGAGEQGFVRSLLAGSLVAIMAQQLVARPEGGRRALFELMVATPAVRNLIRDGKTHLLPALLQTGKGQGMQLFDSPVLV
ncbi:PilT/PilU family type 4a pilus ATPase [Acerihabitans sp. TG2]|uniref:type IV pilus twitching motility protein PilT n=1 Tax=Acerihabitans sp. TG2 TaxID=3096008 RepID=UPI002B2277D5|nr:PilT/PilU family type 4a pilus ATPase [Acerihabitans sp. TG2]MEA9391696.1 PilT/PilU family type 4a pilus ATPase [Acerihabitans sp. TG2]